MTVNGAAGERVVSPALVGRADELEALVAAVLAPPAVVVVEGEAGIGKTRLVSEFRSRPEVADSRFIVGLCRRIREPFPLGPVLDVVRGLGDDLAAMRLSPVVGALRSLLPEVAELLPPQPAPLNDRDAERHRVFRALVEVFVSLGPAVLALEDLHWADEHTADFVSYLLTEPPPKLSLVLTFRGEEVAPEVRAVTGKLPASVTRAHVALVPLNAEQTGELAAAILGLDRVSTEFAVYLCKRSGGLPFVIEELLALLQARGTLVRRDGGWARRDLDELDVPSGVRDPVLERMSRLSTGARSVVEAAAVLQIPVTADVLVATCGTARDRVLQGLYKSLEHGLLVEHGSTIGFRHVLAAQAVYDELAGPRRMGLHSRAATALKALPEAPLGQVAHHLRHAGRLNEWVETAEQAADWAVALGHDEEAARLLEDVIRHATLDTDRLGRLAIKLGRAAAETLYGARERADLLSAVLEQKLPTVVRGELRFWLVVQLEQAGGEDHRVHRLLAEAVDELDDLPDLKARAMVVLGFPSVPGATVAEHRRWLDRTSAILPSVGDPRVRNLVAGKIAMVLVRLGDPTWRRLTDQIVEETGGVPRHRQEIRAFVSIGQEAYDAGHFEAAERLLGAALEGAVTAASTQLELRARVALALVGYCRGAWDGLDATVATLSDQLADNAPARNDVDVVAGCLALARGDLATARETLDRCLLQLGQRGGSDYLALPAGALIRMAVGGGDLSRAMAVARRFVAVVESVPFCAGVVRGLPAVTEAMVADGQLSEVRTLVHRWARKLRKLDAPFAVAALPHARGFLAKATGNWSVAADRFGTAADRYDGVGCPYEAAQAREQAASSLLASEDVRRREGGEEMLRAARASYQRLGATWDIARTAALARARGVSLPAHHRRGRRGYGNELSPRELEVAALVAGGLTNKEAAAELFVSVKTIEWHVSALMRKLGVASRRSIASRLPASGPGGPAQKTRVVPQ